MNNISYRKGAIEDLQQIKTVIQNAYGQYRNILSPENIKTFEAGINSDETYTSLFKYATCFVAVNDEKILGVVFFVPRRNPFKWFEAEWCYIRLLGVLPGFEGRGIGRILTELCIEKAGENGEKTIALHTSEFQNAARHIYESMGFRQQKQFELFGKNYWLYTLSLGNNNTDDFTFQKAGINDVKALVESRITFALEISGTQSKEQIEELRTQMTGYFLKSIADNTSISIIARSQTHIAGIGSLHIREMPGNFKNPSGKWGYIMNMYTFPEYRKKGICSKILNTLVSEGKKIGITSFELHATKEGEPVYLKNGFELHYEPTLRKYEILTT